MNKKWLAFAILLSILVFPVQSNAQQSTETKKVDGLERRIQQQVYNQVKTQGKIFSYYVDVCGGNEKLGKILYDKRYGRLAVDYYPWNHLEEVTSIVLNLGIIEATIPTGKEPSKQDVQIMLDVTKTGMHFLEECYPDGAWVISENKTKHIEGPLVRILTAQRKTKDAKEFKLALYNESGEEVYAVTGEKISKLRGNIFHKEKTAQKRLEHIEG